MINDDLSCWPVVLSFSSEKPDLEALRNYSNAWTTWLDRGEPFATLRVVLDSRAYGHPPGGAQEGKQWFNSNSDRFHKQVVGMATAAPADVAEKVNKTSNAPKYGGVPKQGFTSVEAALEWLLPLLAARIPDLDTGSLRTRVLDRCAEAGSILIEKSANG